MSHLIQRLRDAASARWSITYEWDDTFREAAAALEARDREIERLRNALQKIAAYDPGMFRPLVDEIAIWNIARAALNPTEQKP